MVDPAHYESSKIIGYIKSEQLNDLVKKEIDLIMGEEMEFEGCVIKEENQEWLAKRFGIVDNLDWDVMFPLQHILMCKRGATDDYDLIAPHDVEHISGG